ncbi:MAG: peptidoglycan editing factor PgeF [Lachnospiraceae bacterium]|nr:peptidoglycan editing factor PgeF [Lachnospiraceae bacterium]
MCLEKRTCAETTRVVTENNIPRISYLSLEQYPWLINAFSTREGGVSTGMYESMNLTFTRGDDPDKVRENFRLFGESIGVDITQMVYSDQQHTTNVMEVTSEHLGMGILRDRNFSDIDGIMTNEPGVCLVTSYADCVPLYFVDPVNRAIAASHSGWRGTVGNICQKTVDEMNRLYGSKPADIIACIGPSICADCYEVGSDVAGAFIENYGDDAKTVVLPHKEKNPGKYQLDLTRANVINMERAGILPEHISVPDLCTCCNKDVLHSHRGSCGQRGGLCAFLMIR